MEPIVEPRVEQKMKPKVKARGGANCTVGKWTAAEHQSFLEAMDRFGNNWRKAQEHIGTRTSAQIRSHAQKYYEYMRKKARLKARLDPARGRALFVVTREFWHKCSVQRSDSLHTKEHSVPNPNQSSPPDNQLAFPLFTSRVPTDPASQSTTAQGSQDFHGAQVSGWSQASVGGAGTGSQTSSPSLACVSSTSATVPSIQ